MASIGKKYKQLGSFNSPIERVVDIDSEYIYFESKSRAPNKSFNLKWEAVSDDMPHETAKPETYNVESMDLKSWMEASTNNRINSYVTPIKNIDIPWDKLPRDNNDPVPTFHETSSIIVDTDLQSKARRFAMQSNLESLKPKELVEDITKPWSEQFGTGTSNNTTDETSHVSAQKPAISEEKTSVPNSFIQKIKRNRAFNLVITIPKLLPDPNFIRLMVDNSDEPIVDTLTEEIFQEILKESDIIRMEVKDQIEKYIYGNFGSVTRPKKKPVSKK